MKSNPISPTAQKDENGNSVYLENAENFNVNVLGKNNSISILNRNPNARVKITVKGDNNIVEFGRCILKDFSITIGSHEPVHGAVISVGDHFSVEPGCLFEVFMNHAEVKIGEQCMFSRDIKIHFGDSPHLIFDMETGDYKDNEGSVVLGQKVWVGERSYLTKRASIADESIVAACSVVTRAFTAPNCVIGGNPAKVMKEKVQWYRNRSRVPRPSKYADSIDHYDAKIQDAINSKANREKDGVQMQRRTTWAGKWPAGATLLFGVGAMKAGTSWLHSYLKSHPEVHFSPQKEVHYFDVLDSPSERHHLNSKIDSLSRKVEILRGSEIEQLQSGIEKIQENLKSIKIYENARGSHEEYREYLLQGYSSQKVIGDITPSYCGLSQDRFLEMSALTPDSKFLFVMRDPVDRLWSAIRMRSRTMKGEFDINCRNLAEAILGNKKHPMLTRSEYKSTIGKLQKFHRNGRALFLFYENMFTVEIQNEICDFLNIDRHPVLEEEKVNVGVPSRIPEDIRVSLRELLDDEYVFIFSTFPETVPEEWKWK